MIEEKANQENLRDILEQVKKETELAVVFDLDSTLFSTDHRTEKIILHSIQQEDFKKEFAGDLEEIKKFKIDSKDWSIEDIFEKQGYKEDHPAVCFIQKKWKDLFFKNEYLKYDKPYKGSVEFVNEIKKSGAEIFYLTARGQNQMKEGTMQSLKSWNFPIKKEDHLILKTDLQMSDAIYKSENLEIINKKFKKVFFFENEPVILNLVHRELPQIKLFWINSTHSKRENPPEKAQTVYPIYNF